LSIAPNSFLLDCSLCQLVIDALKTLLLLFGSRQLPWIKVNTDGFLIGIMHLVVLYVVIMEVHSSVALQCLHFIGNFSVFASELLGFMHAMELTTRYGWTNLWIDVDSSSALLDFKNPTIVPCFFRN